MTVSDSDSDAISGNNDKNKCKKNGLPNPEKSDSPVNPKTIPMKHCVLL